MKLQGTVLGRLVGHLGFLILMVMSVVLAQERVLFVDSAAQLFEMIQRESFVIYDHRYTMAVTQLLPLVGIKIGLSLPMLVVLYSVAAPLLAYLAYLLLAYRVKDLPLALLLLLPMLCMCHTFFHAISETFSLMIYATLLLALLKHRRNTLLHAVGVVLCTVACVFMHPIGMFFVVFLLGYHLVESVGTRRAVSAEVFSCCQWKGLALVPMAVTLVASVIVKMSLTSGHDAGYMPHWADVVGCLRHPDEITVVKKLFDGTVGLYLIPLILYVLGLVWHVCRHQWSRLAWCLVFNVGFIFLTAVVYRTDSSPICVERAWLPLAFFAGVPVMCEVFSAGRIQNALSAALLALLMCSFGTIVHNSKPYRLRLDLLQTVIDKERTAGHRKIVAPISEVPVVEVQSWAVAFETLILSSWNGPDGTVTLYCDELPYDEAASDYEVVDAYLAVPWNRLWNYSTLNPRYFRLPQQSYVVVGGDCFRKLL